MPCKYVIAMDGTVVLERWTGTVDRHELMTHKMQQAGDPAIKQGAAVLSDCRSAVFAIAPSDVSELSAMEQDPSNRSKVSRYAFLVNNDIYPTASRFSDQVNSQGKCVIIFNSLDVAAVWLGLDSVTVRKLMDATAG